MVGRAFSLSTVQGLHDDLTYCEEALGAIKELLHEAARGALEELREGPAGSLQEMLNRALAAFRAWRDGKFRKAWHLAEHDPKLRSWFSIGGHLEDVQGFGNHLAGLMRRHLQEQQDAAASSDGHVAKKTFNQITMLSRA